MRISKIFEEEHTFIIMIIFKQKINETTNKRKKKLNEDLVSDFSHAL